MNSTIKAHLAVLTANLIFGINYSVVKLVTPTYLKPFGLNVVRVIVTVVLLWILYLLKPTSVAIEKKHIGRFIVCAATGVAINQMTFIKGLSLTTPIHAALLALASPIFIIFIAAWLLKEGLGWLKILGLSLGVGGAILLVTAKESTGGGSQIILGDLFILVNAISYAFYLVLVRKLMAVYTPLHVLRWVFTFGGLLIIPFGWNEFVSAEWSTFSTTTLVAIAFVALGATFFAYMLNVYGLQHLSASVTGTYIYTQPFFASIIALLFYGEHFSIEKGVAAILIFAGVYITTYKKTQPETVEV